MDIIGLSQHGKSKTRHQYFIIPEKWKVDWTVKLTWLIDFLNRKIKKDGISLMYDT